MSKPSPHFGEGNRSLLESHGAGKGSKTRVTDPELFRRNFGEIKFKTDSDDSFQKTARGIKKTYRS